MNMIEARKKQTGGVLLICGFSAYLFLATFNPFLHNHSFCLSHCECHKTHEEFHSEEHNSQDKDRHCPACDFLLKAYDSTILPTTPLLFVNHQVDYTVLLLYDNICQSKYFSTFLQRAPPEFFAI